MKAVLKIAVIISLIGSPIVVPAQSKKIARNNLVWFGDFTKAKINDKWSIYFDFGFRRTEWLNKWSQVLFRPGITYAVNPNLSATVGVAYFDHYSTKYVKPEFRGWQQFLFNENLGRIKIGHRIRIEERFNRGVANDKLTNGYKYNTRYRYQLSAQIPINRPALENRTFYLQFSDEIMVNSGREIVYNYFDQNRAAAGIGFKVSDLFNISVSYMNDFTEKNQANSFENNNVIVLNLYHVFNFKKKNAGK